jgi:hypothetical protein
LLVQAFACKTQHDGQTTLTASNAIYALTI